VPSRLLVSALLLLVAGVVMSDRRFDYPTFYLLQQMTALVSPAVWSAWSVLGLGLCAVLIAALASDDRMAPIASMLWTLVIAGIALQVFKRVWVLPRPLAVLPPESFRVIGLPLRAGSMPSGHAAMLAALACALAREAWRRRLPALALVVILLGAMGCVARVAVGVHWPSDVLVGAAVGLLGIVAGDAIDARWGLRRALSTSLGRRVFAVVQAVAAIVLLVMHTGYPLALAVQWALGVASVASAGWRWYRADHHRAPASPRVPA